MSVRACPPLELCLSMDGRRCLPLSSLRHVLEWQLHAAPEEASLESLLEAVGHAEEAPLPGHTPERAGAETPGDIPGLELVEPGEAHGHALHPHELAPVPPCSNCYGALLHEEWCPVGTGPVDPLAV